MSHSNEPQIDDYGYDRSFNHPLPVGEMLLTFAGLLFLTWLTYAVTVYDFGYTINLVVAMAIAFMKASLVAWIFMHLKADAPLNGIILIGSLLFVTLFITFALMDTNAYQGFLERPSIVQTP
ncbi:cytochrome C oxidase subunit IV family protein [Mucisphaera sp.]|uniref:cytochrome C oxidase subunit IV family protein n=1 Tax=Mucisphaera sp. TaxID=2913024 RepID=UPI003D10B8B2